MSSKNKRPFWDAAPLFFRRLFRVLSNNLGLKLLSVLLALFLWSYVITSSPSITREKTISALDINVIGQTVLSARGLSLLTDVGNLVDATVRIKMPQSAYALVSAENVRVELDLSSIRSTGKQSVRLRGTSSYGSVVNVWPEYVDLEIENQDQRYVPVNALISGKTDPNTWYSVSRLNPSQITVTGPASVVQQISSALVRPDVTGRTETHNRAEKFVLLDGQGNEITTALSPTTSVSMTVEIYPMKALPVVADSMEAISGTVPEGYEISNVLISPATLNVAGDQTLLDGLTSLSVEPVDVADHTKTFTAITNVNTLKGVRNISSEEVSVTVEISEQTIQKRVQGVTIELRNLPSGLTASASAKRIDLQITGPYNSVRSLRKDGVSAVVNLAGLGVGVHTLPIEATVNDQPTLSCLAIPETVTVTIQ